MTTGKKYSNLEEWFPDFCYDEMLKKPNIMIENNNAFATIQVVGF